MKLKFSNVGKISEAEIEVNSITVIAGNNDTGKSTVGKLLYAIPTALNLFTSEFWFQSKRRAILDELKNLARWVERETATKYTTKYMYFLEDSEWNPDEKSLDRHIRELVVEIEKEVLQKDYNNKKQIELICKNLLDYVNSSSHTGELKFLVIQDLLLTEFSSTLTSEFQKNTATKIRMEEDNGDIIDCTFLDNKLQKSSEVKVTRDFSKTFYIDNPFILDRISISDNRIHLNFNNVYHEHKHTEQLIKSLSIRETEQNYFDQLLQKEKIEQLFTSVIDGHIKISRKGYQYHTDQFNEPLNMESVSTGIKSFAIIKLLLELGHLHNSEFLILDEPEIHLHPDWQLKYAELIVLLSREYNMRIVLTTHSPYFVEAIELYSKLHKIDEDVRYYKTEPDGKMSKIIDVTHCIEKLYEDMARPFRKLEELEDELDAE